MRLPAPVRQTLGALLRLALSGAILAWLWQRTDTRALAEAGRECFRHGGWLAAGALCAYLALHAGMLRWRLILAAQGLRLSAGRCFQVYFIGLFFNVFMFGATGGDLVRALYAARETGRRQAEAVASVFIDRVIGLLVLYLLALAMLAARAGFFLASWETRLAGLVLLGMVAATLAGLLALFNLRRLAGWLPVRRVRRHPRLGLLLARALRALELSRRQTGVLVHAGLLSLAVHLLGVCQFYCLGRCFQAALGFGDYLAVVPIIIAVAVIPITPGGLGLREGFAVALFGALGVPAALALPLSLLAYFLNVAWSLVGGPVFIWYSTGVGRAPRPEIGHAAADENRQAGITGAHE